MRRLGVVVASLMLATTLAQGSPAQARDTEWCAEDPVFQVLGAHFRLTTEISASASSVGSVAYVVDLPANAQGASAVHFPQGRRLATSASLTYNGAAYDGSGGFAVSGTVTVTGPDGVAVSVTLAGPSVATATYAGSTNSAIAFQFDAAAR